MKIITRLSSQKQGESYISEIEKLTVRLSNDFGGSFNKDELTELLDLVTSGWWYWNVETGYDYLSKGWCAQLGYTQDELDFHVDTWYKIMHPDDRPKAEKAMDAHLTSGKTYQLTARYKHKKGHWVTLKDIGKVIKFKGSKPFIMVGHETKVDYDA